MIIPSKVDYSTKRKSMEYWKTTKNEPDVLLIIQLQCYYISNLKENNFYIFIYYHKNYLTNLMN